MGSFNRDDRRIPRDKVGTKAPAADRFEEFKDRNARHLAYSDAYYRARQSGVSLVDLPEPGGTRDDDVDEAIARLAERAAGGKIEVRAVPPADIQS